MYQVLFPQIILTIACGSVTILMFLIVITVSGGACVVESYAFIVVRNILPNHTDFRLAKVKFHANSFSC